MGTEAECKSQDGWLVIDNILNAEALARMNAFLHAAAIWYHPKHGGRYLMATLFDGLATPLLLQISEELRRAFPSILGPHELQHAWAFKHDNTNLADAESGRNNQSGVGLHADDAAVNINIWLTPLDTDSSVERRGGLILYNVEAIAAENFTGYNKDVARDIIKRSTPLEFSYRQNRW